MQHRRNLAQDPLRMPSTRTAPAYWQLRVGTRNMQQDFCYGPKALRQQAFHWLSAACGGTVGFRHNGLGYCSSTKPLLSLRFRPSLGNLLHNPGSRAQGHLIPAIRKAMCWMIAFCQAGTDLRHAWPAG
jgi:hypothetical protein